MLYINSSRGGHGAPPKLHNLNEENEHHQRQESELLESVNTSSIEGGNAAQSDINGGGSSSVATQRDGPPKVYEEMIQILEADVRKHIRIEQQLKLHIETIESRLDELESENEKLISECTRLE